MASLDIKFNGEIFRKDFPMVIATNRSSAVLLPVRLAYDAAGYVAGTLLARNTVSGLFEAYDNSASSGLGVASCVVFQSIQASDFDSTAATGTTTAVGIFGGCTLYKDRLVGYDSAGLADLGGRIIIDASGVELLKF
jgi:hypothetical protein